MAKAGLSLWFLLALAWPTVIWSQQSSPTPLLLTFTTIHQKPGVSSYIASVNVSGTIKDFTMDTSRPQVFMANCTKADDTFVKSSFTLEESSTFLGTKPQIEVPGIDVFCSKSIQTNVLGLATNSRSSFPLQLTQAAKLPLRFSYCLGQDGGNLYFGQKGPYTVYFNTDVLNATSVPLTYFPLVAPGSYQLQLSNVEVKSRSVATNTVMEIGLNSVYTSLPSAAYRFVRSQFLAEAAQKKLQRDQAFGELDLCYGMTSQQLAGFSNVSLVLGGSKWIVSPDNYLIVSKVFHGRGMGIAACFGFVDAKNDTSVIGTLQQENNFVEYDVGARKLGVSGSLVATKGLTCAATRGT